MTSVRWRLLVVVVAVLLGGLAGGYGTGPGVTRCTDRVDGAGSCTELVELFVPGAAVGAVLAGALALAATRRRR